MSIRTDLLDDGVFRSPSRGAVSRSRRPNQFDGETGVVPASNDSATVYVGLDGATVADDNLAAAKVVVKGGNATHYIRVATGGVEQGQLLNPRGMYFKPETLNHTNRQSGQRVYEYMKVTKEAFADYSLFLRTKDRTFYARAERAANDA